MAAARAPNFCASRFPSSTEEFVSWDRCDPTRNSRYCSLLHAILTFLLEKGSTGARRQSHRGITILARLEEIGLADDSSLINQPRPLSIPLLFSQEQGCPQSKDVSTLTVREQTIHPIATMDYLYFARNKVIATYLRYGVSRRQSSSQWGVAVDEVLDIPSRQVGRTIKVHKYGPRDTASPNPVLINFHGSGFTMPLHGTDEEFCVQIVKQTPYTVLDASYRLAPENPFPAAVHDAEDVVKYVLARPEEYDASRIAVSGFSAGGALALALSGQVFPKGTFRSIIAFYPVTNLSVDPREKVAPDSSGRAIPSYLADFFNDSYCPNRAQRSDPLASPSFIKADNYPANMLMITCAQDSLAPEAEEVAERVKGVPGNHVVVRRLELCKHGWDKEPLTSGGEEEKRKEEAYALAVDMLMR